MQMEVAVEERRRLRITMFDGNRQQEPAAGTEAAGRWTFQKQKNERKNGCRPLSTSAQQRRCGFDTASRPKRIAPISTDASVSLYSVVWTLHSEQTLSKLDLADHCSTLETEHDSTYTTSPPRPRQTMLEMPVCHQTPACCRTPRRSGQEQCNAI